MATALEIMVEEFNALHSEIKERWINDAPMLTQDDYRDRFSRIAERIKEVTGMNYDGPCLQMLFVDYERTKI